MTTFAGFPQNTRIALVGCGDIGCRLAEKLMAAGAEVHGLRRNIAALPANVIPHATDVQNPAALSILHDIAFDYVVVTLSPTEMSDAAYAATYVQGLRNILSVLNSRRLRKLFWISSTSVYGQSDGSVVDEYSATNPIQYSGQRQLEAEQLLNSLKNKACIVRFSGIYRDGRHRLVEQICSGKISRHIENDYMTNRIHIADCVGVLEHLIKLDASGASLEPVYLASDSSPVLYSDLIHWLATKMNITLPDSADSNTPRVGSKHCNNALLLASGYQFIYPTYKEGFRSIIYSLGSDNSSS